MDTNDAQARLIDYLRPLMARWWLILLTVVIATGGIYAYYVRKPNVYTASTLVYYQDPGDPVTGAPSQPQTDRNVIDAATLLNSRATAATVAQQIGHAVPAGTLQQNVSIGSKAGSDFITISATAGAPKLAAAITNAYAGTLVASLGNQVTYQIQTALKLSQNQYAQLPTGTAGLVQRANLATQIARLQLALKVPTLVAKQVDPAAPPQSPTSPKPVRNALFALVLGLIAAISIAYGLERFDRRLKDPEQMERAYGRTLLAVLPHAGDPLATSWNEPTLSHEFREPFRVLRTNIELESLDAPPRTIVVSSAMPGEGKSTVVRNLALAIREAGKTIAVVDLDLRHPSLGEMFGLDEGAPGVTEVLRHEVDLAGAVVQVPVKLHPFAEFMAAKAAGQLPEGSPVAPGRAAKAARLEEESSEPPAKAAKAAQVEGKSSEPPAKAAKAAQVEGKSSEPPAKAAKAARVEDGSSEVRRRRAARAAGRLEEGSSDPVVGATNGGGNGNGNGRAGRPQVSVLLTGALPANPAAVLASDRLLEVIGELRETHDVVLIDSAPVLAVSDTVPLLRHADAALFVGRLDVTTRDTAKRMIEYLGRIPDLNLLGMVANDLSRMDASGYGYGYGYGYGKYAEAGTDAKKSPRRQAKKSTKRDKRSKQPA